VSRVEKELNAKDRTQSFETLNAGIASYSPILEYFFLCELLEKGLRFDFAVIVLDVSDPQDEVTYTNFLERQDIAYKTNEELAKAQFHSKAFIEIYKQSALFRGVWKFYFRDDGGSRDLWRDGYFEDRYAWTEDDELIDLWGLKGLKSMEENLDRMLARLDRERIPYAIAIYPWPVHLRSKRAKCVYEEFVIEYCRKRGAALLNLFPAFKSLPDAMTLFVDGDIHWNEEGHRFAADQIAGFLKDNFSLRRRSGETR
jgi:hypothetical protein